MLAHAASAQGISAVENMCGREHVLDHNTVPAACFTHPEVFCAYAAVKVMHAPICISSAEIYTSIPLACAF